MCYFSGRRCRADAFRIVLGPPSALGCCACSQILFLPRRKCLRLLMFCTCPPLCTGTMRQTLAWVWRDIRDFFCLGSRKQRGHWAALLCTHAEAMVGMSLWCSSLARLWRRCVKIDMLPSCDVLGLARPGVNVIGGLVPQQAQPRHVMHHMLPPQFTCPWSQRVDAVNPRGFHARH